MPLINCEIELILNWSADCVIIYTNVNNRQQALDTDPTAIQQINFTVYLDRAGNYYRQRIYFILEEAKETIFKFSQGTVKVL